MSTGRACLCATLLLSFAAFAHLGYPAGMEVPSELEQRKTAQVCQWAFCVVTHDMSREVSFLLVNTSWLVLILMLNGTAGKSSIFLLGGTNVGKTDTLSG